ncbi:MAG: hypothetical protein VB128_03145 [Sedimentibacter saalensis]|uniref:hypothetical protein n=1 Tax=Sedimentibacter saalensis TaxID=130788 RepID=UPI002B210D5C|nr:hypothetical protein [Sedimentibacter saalensis]MEA5093931.1 hypothetical protein [Sedimentibacter saalensis]
MDISLRILDLFRFIFEKLGVDYLTMRAIVSTKLVLDRRRAPAMPRSNSENQSEKSYLQGYLFHLIFGIFLAAIIYIINDNMLRMAYFAGAFFFMTTMYLVSDFSFVLLDTKDKNIIMTKPVESKTVSVSKFVHIFIYMVRLNIFLAGPSMVVFILSYGLAAAFIFVLEVIFMDLLIFIMTIFIYFAVLRFFDGELLRNIINTIQILLTVLLSIGYQVAVRMIDFTSIKSMNYNFSFRDYFNPVLWFGAPFEIIFSGGKSSYLYVFSALLVVVPLISFVFYLKLSKVMEQLLLKLESGETERLKKHFIQELVGKILCRNTVQYQSFHFANAVLRSDRSLKLKIYPALSTGILLPVLMIFNMGIRGEKYQATGIEYLYLYFVIVAISSVVRLVNYSSAWKGSYVYISSGFECMEEVYRGVLKTILFRFMVPVEMLGAIIYIALFRNLFLFDIAVVFIAGIAALPLIGKVYIYEYPFSRPLEESNQKESIDKMLLTILIAGAFAGLHALSRLIHNGTMIYAAVLVVFIPLFWKYVLPKSNK